MAMTRPAVVCGKFSNSFLAERVKTTRWSATGSPTSPSSDLGFDGFERLARLVAPRLRYRPVVKVFPELPLLLQVDNYRSSRTMVVYKVLDSSHRHLLLPNGISIVRFLKPDSAMRNEWPHRRGRFRPPAAAAGWAALRMFQ